jgi:ERCC4-type nuclease
MEIYLDNRERDLIKLFNENKNDIILKNLEIGDIIYKKDEEVIYIVERKTFNDLGASINDGRYKEQKIRLLSNSNRNLFYILEGNMSKCTTLNQKALLGSIVNMTFRDNIKLIFSSDINQTYKILIQIKDKFNSGKFSKIVGETNNNNNYVSSIKLNKKENMTKLNCNIIQLATIPGVSKNMSSIILEKYNTIDKLIEEYKKNGENILAELSMGKRKLGKVLSKKIYDILI